MRWLLLAAAAVVAALLLFFLRDDEPGRRETHAPDVPASKKDYWRKQRAQQQGGGGAKTKREEPGRNADPARLEWHTGVGPGLTLVGDVTFEVIYEDGTPAAGATVGYTHNAGQPEDDGMTVRTDKKGIAKLRLPREAEWFWARRGSLVGGPVRLSTAPGDRHKLMLGKPYSIRGAVLMPDRSPAADAIVSLNFWDGWEWRLVYGRTSINGTFDFRPLPLRWIKRMNLNVYKAKRRFPPNRFQWPKAVTDLTLRLTSETVRGRVVDGNGAPVANAWVSTGEKPVANAWVSTVDMLKTDTDGRFETAFQRREGALIRVNTMVRVLKADDRDIEIVLRSGKPLHGRLLNHDREPLAGSWVKLWMPVLGVRPLAGAGTDKDGRFQFLALAEGPHKLGIQLQGAAAERREWGGSRGLTNFETPDYFVGIVHATDEFLEVVLPKPIPARIRLTRPDGRAVAAKSVTLSVRRGQLEILERTWASSQAMDTVPFKVWEAGAYNVLVTTAFHEPARRQSISITETGPNDFDLPLTKRPHLR